MTTIRKADGLAFYANMSYILSHLGIKVDDNKWEIQSKRGIYFSVNVYPPKQGAENYCVYSRSKAHPVIFIDKGCIGRANMADGEKYDWIISECDDHFRGWMRPYEEVMKGLCLMIHGHDNFPNAIAKRGRLENFIPEKGHLVYGKEKLTVAAFRKKYVTALGIEGCLMMDGSFLADNVPFSPFGKDALICIFPQ